MVFNGSNIDETTDAAVMYVTWNLLVILSIEVDFEIGQSNKTIFPEQSFWRLWW